MSSFLPFSPQQPTPSLPEPSPDPSQGSQGFSRGSENTLSSLQEHELSEEKKTDSIPPSLRPSREQNLKNGQHLPLLNRFKTQEYKKGQHSPSPKLESIPPCPCMRTKYFASDSVGGMRRSQEISELAPNILGHAPSSLELSGSTAEPPFALSGAKCGVCAQWGQPPL